MIPYNEVLPTFLEMFNVTPFDEHPDCHLFGGYVFDDIGKWEAQVRRTGEKTFRMDISRAPRKGGRFPDEFYTLPAPARGD